MQPTPHELIARVPYWRHAQQISSELLPGGMTNRNYLVTVDSQRFVLRVSGPNTLLLGINRRAEYQITHAAAQVGIAPDVMYFIEPEGHLITQFIPGHKASREHICQPAVINQIAQLLKRIHSLPAVATTFSPFRSIESYSSSAAHLGSTFPEKFAWFLEQMYTIEQAEQVYPVPLCLCHNDLIRGNLLFDANIRVIDWEYASMGNLFFDLATVILDNRFSLKQEQWFLECYFGKVLPTYTEHLTRMKRIWLLREAVWGLLQSNIADIDFDFQKFATARFVRLAHHLTTGRDT